MPYKRQKEKKIKDMFKLVSIFFINKQSQCEGDCGETEACTRLVCWSLQGLKKRLSVRDEVTYRCRLGHWAWWLGKAAMTRHSSERWWGQAHSLLDGWAG